jgi:hypothetical protein
MSQDKPTNQASDQPAARPQETQPADAGQARADQRQEARAEHQTYQLNKSTGEFQQIPPEQANPALKYETGTPRELSEVPEEQTLTGQAAAADGIDNASKLGAKAIAAAEAAPGPVVDEATAMAAVYASSHPVFTAADMGKAPVEGTSQAILALALVYAYTAQRMKNGGDRDD